MRANNYDEYDEDEYKDFEYWKKEYGIDYSEDWSNLLLRHPQLAEYFTNALWDEFSPVEWTELLKAQPQFADKCTKYKGWEKFDSWHWWDLLSSQPQFTEKAKEYSSSWAWRLSIKPELAKECKCWGKFYYWDWIKLLKSQPQFADKCPNKIYDRLSQEDWEVLEALHPGVFEDKHMLSTLRKLAK